MHKDSHDGSGDYQLIADRPNNQGWLKSLGNTLITMVKAVSGAVTLNFALDVVLLRTASPIVLQFGDQKMEDDYFYYGGIVGLLISLGILIGDTYGRIRYQPSEYTSEYISRARDTALGFAAFASIPNTIASLFPFNKKFIPLYVVSNVSMGLVGAILKFNSFVQITAPPESHDALQNDPSYVQKRTEKRQHTYRYRITNALTLSGAGTWLRRNFLRDIEANRKNDISKLLAIVIPFFISITMDWGTEHRHRANVWWERLKIFLIHGIAAFYFMGGELLEMFANYEDDNEIWFETVSYIFFVIIGVWDSYQYVDYEKDLDELKITLLSNSSVDIDDNGDERLATINNGHGAPTDLFHSAEFSADDDEQSLLNPTLPQ